MDRPHPTPILHFIVRNRDGMGAAGAVLLFGMAFFYRAPVTAAPHCAADRSAIAPVRLGESGYRSEPDSDSNGVA